MAEIRDDYKGYQILYDKHMSLWKVMVDGLMATSFPQLVEAHQWIDKLEKRKLAKKEFTPVWLLKSGQGPVPGKVRTLVGNFDNYATFTSDDGKRSKEWLKRMIPRSAESDAIMECVLEKHAAIRDLYAEIDELQAKVSKLTREDLDL